MQRASFEIDGLVYSNEKCPIHGARLVSVGNLKPFCKLCQQGKDEEEKQKQVKEFTKTQITGFLHTHSLVDRVDVFNDTFDNFEAQKGTNAYLCKAIAGKTAVAYARYPDKKFNTILLGKAGTGKTHLAMSILNYVNEHSFQKCLLLSIPRLIRKGRDWTNDHSCTIWSQDYAIEQIRTADLVVIDDLGAETANGDATNFVQNMIFDIYEANQRIITTTNLSKTRLRKTYDDRLLSRIEDHAAGHVCDFSKLEDRRMRA